MRKRAKRAIGSPAKDAGDSRGSPGPSVGGTDRVQGSFDCVFRPLIADENFAQDDKSKSHYFGFAWMTIRTEKNSGPKLPGRWILRLCSGQAAEGGCPHMGIVVPQSQRPHFKVTGPTTKSKAPL